MKTRNDRHSYGSGYYDGLAVAQCEFKLFVGFLLFMYSMQEECNRCLGSGLYTPVRHF